MNSAKSIKLFLIVVFALSSTSSYAADPVVLKEGIEQYSMGVHLDILEDPQGEWTITDIVTAKMSEQFVASTETAPLLEQTESVYWLRFRFRSRFEESRRWLLQLWSRSIAEVAVFLPLAEGKFERRETGASLPFANRDVSYRSFVFRLTSHPMDQSIIYLRLKLHGATSAGMTLWNPDRFWRKVDKENFVWGIIYGVLLLAILYNSLLFVALKDSSYLFYVLFTFFLGLQYLINDGFAYQYLWPRWVWWNNNGEIFIGSLLYLSFLLFTRTFLHTRNFAPVFDKIILALAALFVVIIVPRFFFPSSIYLALQWPIPILVIIVGILFWIRGHRPARFFVLAWAAYLVVSVASLINEISGLSESSLISFITRYGGHLAALLNVILLSLALADRVNVMRDEKEEAQFQALQSQKILTEELESEVQNRTLKLSTTIQELKNTEVQLVQSAKMAGLGTLVAGVAHEINNPANFIQLSTDTVETEIQRFQHFLRKLVEGSTDPEVSAAFEDRFQKIVEPLKNIKDGSTRIEAIVRDLRTFSRLGEGAKERANVIVGLKSTLRLVQTRYEKTVRFEEDFRDASQILCWPSQLNQVFMNVIVNACQAIEMKQSDKSVPGTLHIRSFLDKDEIGIRFSDSGIGMSDEVKQRLYEPFFTTKEVGRGMGLGMSIAYSIIEKHHGRLEVESEMGEGTVVTILLPLSGSVSSENT